MADFQNLALGFCLGCLFTWGTAFLAIAVYKTEIQKP